MSPSSLASCHKIQGHQLIIFSPRMRIRQEWFFIKNKKDMNVKPFFPSVDWTLCPNQSQCLISGRTKPLSLCAVYSRPLLCIQLWVLSHQVAPSSWLSVQRERWYISKTVLLMKKENIFVWIRDRFQLFFTSVLLLYLTLEGAWFPWYGL